MSAVSRKLTPTSSAASTTRAVASTSRRQPKLLQPRPTSETESEPIRRVSMPSTSRTYHRRRNPPRSLRNLARRVRNPPWERWRPAGFFLASGRRDASAPREKAANRRPRYQSRPTGWALPVPRPLASSRAGRTLNQCEHRVPSKSGSDVGNGITGWDKGNPTGTPPSCPPPRPNPPPPRGEGCSRRRCAGLAAAPLARFPQRWAQRPDLGSLPPGRAGGRGWGEDRRGVAHLAEDDNALSSPISRRRTLTGT